MNNEQESGFFLGWIAMSFGWMAMMDFSMIAVNNMINPSPQLQDYREQVEKESK